MIEFSKHILDNGLKVIIQEDFSTPLAAMNILYGVGSRDEDPEMTGLAHLFEHLMFSGSLNIPDYDTPVQLAGGENNAFTNNDITNYYLTLPAANIETGFWLESDRMLGIDLSERNLEVQKRVVAEEFRQRYLNQPYGDLMLRLRPEAYRVHPYGWPTIGKDVRHIEMASLETVNNFFYSHYGPNNAILAVSGAVKKELVIELANKWFGDIPRRKIVERQLPAEPEQVNPRRIVIEKDVPSDLIYKAWHTGKRTDSDFPSLDLLTDLMAGGESGSLYEELVRKKKMFSDINAYVTGDLDPGLLIISGRLMNGISIKDAEDAILGSVNKITEGKFSDEEMEKVRNRYEATSLISNTSAQHKALALCQAEISGDASLVNTEIDRFKAVTREDVINSSKNCLRESNCTTLHYISNTNTEK